MEPYIVTTIVLAIILALVGIGYIIMAVKLKTIRQKKKDKEVVEKLRKEPEPEPIQPVPTDVNLYDILNEKCDNDTKDLKKTEKDYRKVINDLEVKVHARDKDILEIMKTFCKLDEMSQTYSKQSLKTQTKISLFLKRVEEHRFTKGKIYALISHCAGTECYIGVSDQVKLSNHSLRDIHIELRIDSYRNDKTIKINYNNSFDTSISVELLPSYIKLLEYIIYEGIDALKRELFDFITKELKNI